MENGKLTISKVTSNNRDEDYICIALRNERYKLVLEIEIPLKEFALAVTGQGSIDCLFMNGRYEHG